MMGLSMVAPSLFATSLLLPALASIVVVFRGDWIAKHLCILLVGIISINIHVLEKPIANDTS